MRPHATILASLLGAALCQATNSPFLIRFGRLQTPLDGGGQIVSNATYIGDASGLTNIAESDPFFSTSAAAAISGVDTASWHQAAAAVSAIQAATNALDGRLGTVEGWGDWSTNPVYLAAITNETDPVWEAAKSGYATGTPVYAESDPVWEAAKSGYATGTPVYAESDPVWEAAKSGYATGTPVYAESDPVWSAARTNYDGATNALHNRLTALDAASTGAVAVLQGATNTLDGRVKALEGGGAVSNWSAYPAVQGIEIAGNVLSNVMQITPATNFLVLDEPFDADPFSAETWTNTAGGWGWTGDQIIALSNSTCSNLTASIVSGQTYSITVDAGYGLDGTDNVTIALHCGGESITLTNATYGWYNTTHSITASASSGIGFTSSANYPSSGFAIVTYIMVRNITSSNSVVIPRLTVGADTATNLPFDALAAATNALDIRVSALEGGAGGTYPVFLLPVGALEGSWTDFEIKASTNNWASTALYWWKSWTSQPSQNDADAIALFTDPYAGADPRTLYRKTNDVAIATHLASEDSTVEVVIFQPSHNIEGGGTWMTPANTNLVWEWIRVDDGGYEMTPDGSNYWFHPILPEQWMAAPLGQWDWAEIHTTKLAAVYAETYPTLRTNVFDGTNAVYFLNPHNQSNYVIFTP